MPMPGAAEFRVLLDDADEALDKDTFEQIKAHDYDAPDDAEYTISAGTHRKINRLFAALDHQLKSDE